MALDSPALASRIAAGCSQAESVSGYLEAGHLDRVGWSGAPDVTKLPGECPSSGFGFPGDTGRGRSHVAQSESRQVTDGVGKDVARARGANHPSATSHGVLRPHCHEAQPDSSPRSGRRGQTVRMQLPLFPWYAHVSSPRVPIGRTGRRDRPTALRPRKTVGPQGSRLPARYRDP